MERGVIQLTNEEIVIARKALEKVNGSPLTDLIKNRLQVEKKGEDTIQLSENDAELMLDNLPVPNKEEDKHITSLRKKLQQFLAKIRFPEQA